VRGRGNIELRHLGKENVCVPLFDRQAASDCVVLHRSWSCTLISLGSGPRLDSGVWGDIEQLEADDRQVVSRQVRMSKGPNAQKPNCPTNI
jgi:hypothetical protein